MSDAIGTYSKIIAAHTVHTDEAGGTIVYIDRHFLHPGISAQAFDGLRLAQRDVRRPEATYAPHADAQTNDPVQAKLLDVLDANAHEYHTARFDPADLQEGLIQPGMTVAGHRNDVSKFGGIGAVCFFNSSSCCEHILATQTLRLTLPPVLNIRIPAEENLHKPEQIVAYLVTTHGMPVLRSHAIHLYGDGISALDIRTRMGAAEKIAVVAPHGAVLAVDERTIEWLKGHPHAPSGRDWPLACQYWETL